MAFQADKLTRIVGVQWGGDGLVLGVNNGLLYNSDDGDRFTNRGDFDFDPFSRVAAATYHQGLDEFFAIGTHASMSQIARSADQGETWQVAFSDTEFTVGRWIAYDADKDRLVAQITRNELFPGEGEDGLFRKYITSNDGSAWSEGGTKFAEVLGIDLGDWRFARMSRPAFIDVASEDFPRPSTIQLSRNGVNWQSVDTGLGGTFGVTALAAASGVLIAVGTQGAARTTNGVNWSRTLPLDGGVSFALHAIGVAENGRIVAAGTFDNIYHSDNSGLTWGARAKSSVLGDFPDDGVFAISSPDTAK